MEKKVLEEITCARLGCANTFFPKRIWNPLSYNKPKFCGKKCQLDNWMMEKVNKWRKEAK